MDIFVGISLTIVIAAVIAGILQQLRQPLIIGHILTGLLVGSYVHNTVGMSEALEVFAEFGVAILLFIIGLSLRPKILKEVGKIAVITGLGQILFTSLIGFAISRALGFDSLTSVYIAIALTFSSTIIVLKLLSDKKDLDRLYGKISVGFLLVQDLIAALILIVVSSVAEGGSLEDKVLVLLIKAFIAGLTIVLISRYLLPRLTTFFAKSQEFLFLFSIAWGLGLASLFLTLGFSIEIGALLAGIALASSPYSFEISSKLKPLRDFFIIIFFIFLGSQLGLQDFQEHIVAASVFSAFILIGNPLIVIILMGIFGYSKRVGFKAGLTVAQISEFSLILIILATKVGHISPEILPLVTIVGLITIAASTYMIIYADTIFPFVSKFLTIFERNGRKKSAKPVEDADVILFGSNRIGLNFIETFKESAQSFMVVDFDPDAIKSMTEKGIRCLYGDASDNEFLDEIKLDKAMMVISTITDYETNQFILAKVQEVNKKAVIIMISHDEQEAMALYENGSTFVVIPHLLGGKYASMLIAKCGFDLDKFVAEKEKHLKELEKRREIGQPEVVPE